jgi:hypothetical protein
MDYYPEPFGETLGLEPDKMNGPLSYCFCKLGAYGKQCNNSLTSCDDNPCGNRGDCSEGEGKAKCQCKDNWKGGICKGQVMHAMFQVISQVTICDVHTCRL